MPELSGIRGISLGSDTLVGVIVYTPLHLGSTGRILVQHSSLFARHPQCAPGQLGSCLLQSQLASYPGSPWPVPAPTLTSSLITVLPELHTVGYPGLPLPLPQL